MNDMLPNLKRKKEKTQVEKLTKVTSSRSQRQLVAESRSEVIRLKKGIGQ